MVSHGDGHRVMDHHHGHRGHGNPVTGHGHHRCGRSRHPVDAHFHVSRILLQHVVDLGSREHVPAGRVNPDGDIPFAGIQFLTKKTRCDFIAIPGLIGYLPVQYQGARTGILVTHPVPEFLFQLLLPPFFSAACLFANSPASFNLVMFPLIRYRLPPSSSDIGLRFSISRISLAESQPFCLPTA